MGDREKASLRLQFNPQIRLELHGATITSDAGLLAFRELDDALDLTPIASDYVQGHRGRIIATRADQAADLAVLSPYKSLSMAEACWATPASAGH